MNLSMRISKKTPKTKCECKLKKKVKAFFRRITAIKYDMLILLESLSLFMAIISLLFKRDEDSSFFASVSSLVGAYLVLCATYRSKTSSQNKKYENIISAEKND